MFWKTAGLLLVLSSIGLPAAAVAADHKEAPLIQMDPSADIADLYAFLNPNDNSKLVLAMTVNPFSVSSEATSFHFSPDVRYTFRIDNDGDSKPDRNIVVTFDKRSAQGQTFRVRVSSFIRLVGDVTQPSVELDPNPPIIVHGPRDTRAFCGPRDDPFFFDVVGFFRFLGGTGSFTGSDGFSGFNTSAIVVEIPVDLVSSSDSDEPLQIWAETARRTVTIRRTLAGIEESVGPFVQIERMGNPAVATALIPFNRKDRFNIGVPKTDAKNFAGDIVASLESLGTNDENIDILASVAVPDTLKVDLSRPTHYPNGRAPEDDVIDTLLFFIFNQQEVSDGVDANDREFDDKFPFLASPNQPG